MADPTNQNDPTYANDPKYVFSGGRWQYRGDGTVNPNTPAAGGKVTGSTTVGDNPLLGDPGYLAKLALDRRGIGPEINNFANYQTTAQQFRDNAIRQQATNPYNAGIADQSRAAQLALIQQMRGQMNGPSIANMQGQRAMGAMGQQALMQGGRTGMLGAQAGAGGLAGDVGQARLAEVMRAQAGMGGAAGNLRGGDLRSADAQMNSGFQAQQLADQRARFYGSQGARLDAARAQAAADNERLRQQTELNIAGKQLDTWTKIFGAGASAVGTAANMGGK